jgi:hypothetical protein
VRNDPAKLYKIMVSFYDICRQYPGYLGGAASFTAEKFRKIKGFSNKFFGWGGEDDNARFR